MTNCKWIDSKLEAFFTDSLSGEELELCQTHLASCEECRHQVHSMKQVDNLVRRVFQRRTVVATQAGQFNSRARVWKMAALTTASVAAAAVLLGIGFIFLQQTPAPPTAVLPPDPPDLEQRIDNSRESTDRNLTKPEDGEPAKAASEPQLDAATEGGPEFAITDPAGYTESLDSYQGRVFLFAVVSPGQKTAVANLQQIYNAFGSNPGIRIRGVARHREDNFEGITFPMYFNHGSKLLGVKDGEFLLLDRAGKERLLEGSLTDPRNVTRIRSRLGQLGIQ